MKQSIATPVVLSALATFMVLAAGPAIAADLCGRPQEPPAVLFERLTNTEKLAENFRDKSYVAINDAAKSLRALAETHGRNGDWAEAAVRRADNLTAQEALEKNVIDVIAPTLPRLLDKVDGMHTKPDGKVLHTKNAQVDHVEMGLWKSLLDLLIDPNLIALMLSIGLIGIVVELWNPGLIFPGTVGAISLIVGLFGL